MEIRIDEAAAEFARARGGEIFIWISDMGLLHVGTTPPNEAIEWERVPVDGITVSVAASAGAVEYWRVELDRFPRRRLRGVSNMTPGSGQDPSVGGFVNGI